MFFPCIPWNTDAPVDHRPYGTMALVAIHAGLFFARTIPKWLASTGMVSEELAFAIGVFNPFFWITGDVADGAWLRLLLDALFLWGFGLIVEGKLGWYRFLPVYFALAIVHALATERLAIALARRADLPIALGGEPGATAAVYAVAAMAFVWAPRNDVCCLAWIWIKGYSYALSVPALLFVLVLTDGALAWLSGNVAASAVSHATGFAIGFVAAAVLLLLRGVNCQGWDLLSVVLGRTGDVDLEAMRGYQHRPDDQSGLGDDYFARRHRVGLEMLRAHLANRDATAALDLHCRMAAKVKDWQLPEAELVGLIDVLNERHSYPASIPLMFEYLRRFPSQSGPMRLKLAAILLNEENRPGKALGVLERIPAGALPEELFATRDELLREANERAVEGEIELEGDV